MSISDSGGTAQRRMEAFRENFPKNGIDIAVDIVFNKEEIMNIDKVAGSEGLKEVRKNARG